MSKGKKGKHPEKMGTFPGVPLFCFRIYRIYNQLGWFLEERPYLTDELIDKGEQISEYLTYAIKGTGAFRRFKGLTIFYVIVILVLHPQKE